MERFEHAVVNRAHVLRLHGVFVMDDDPEAEVLVDTLVGCHTAQTPCVVVNWAGVRHWNSVGLGGLMRGERKIHKLGGHYRNCGLTENQKKLLSMLKMFELPWNIFETEADAVRACMEITHAGD
jgi:anti-anti-sigma regulatory factor